MEPGAPTNPIGNVIILNVVHEAEVGRKKNVGFDLVDILIEVSLRQSAPNEIGIQGDGHIALVFQAQAAPDVVVVTRIELSEKPTKADNGRPVAG